MLVISGHLQADSVTNRLLEITKKDIDKVFLYFALRRLCNVNVGIQREIDRIKNEKYNICKIILAEIESER